MKEKRKLETGTDLNELEQAGHYVVPNKTNRPSRIFPYWKYPKMREVVYNYMRKHFG